jgi:hypothetical protein
MQGASCCDVVAPFYQPEDLVSAWRLLLQAGEPPQPQQQGVKARAGTDLRTVTTYRYDVVLVTVQVLTNLALDLYSDAKVAFLSRNASALTSIKDEFLSLVGSMDSILVTSPTMLLGKWIADAAANGGAAGATAGGGGLCSDVPVPCGNASAHISASCSGAASSLLNHYQDLRG